jgi:hypothetical protein
MATPKPLARSKEEDAFSSKIQIATVSYTFSHSQNRRVAQEGFWTCCAYRSHIHSSINTKPQQSQNHHLDSFRYQQSANSLLLYFKKTLSVYQPILHLGSVDLSSSSEPYISPGGSSRVLLHCGWEGRKRVLEFIIKYWKRDQTRKIGHTSQSADGLLYRHLSTQRLIRH